MKKVLLFPFLFVLETMALTGWTDPVPVTAAFGAIQEFAFSIAPDNGRGLFSYAGNGGSGVNGIYFKDSVLDYLTWSKYSFLSTENNEALSPAVTGLNNYNYTSWLDNNSGIYRLLFRRDLGSTRELSGGGNCTSLNIFAGANNCVHAVWSEGGVIYYRKGFNNGANWSDIKSVSGLLADRPCIYETGGKLLLLWEAGAPAILRFSLSSDAGVTWSAEENFSSPGITALSGAAASAGAVYTVWEQANKIYFRKYSSSGWEMEKTVSSNTAGSAKYPAVAGEDGGGINVFWTDNRTGDFRIYYSASRDSGMTFAPETELGVLPAAGRLVAASYKNNIHLFWKAAGQIYFRIKDDTAPLAVQISSPTHTQNGAGSNNNCPVFNFAAFDNEGGTGLKGFSFTFDKEPLTRPDSSINLAQTSVSFPRTENGKWYLHVSVSDALGNWSSPAHYGITVNNSSLLPGSEAWCFPNPVQSSNPKIRYFVPEAATIYLTIFNEAGESVLLKTKDALAGINEIDNLETANWANGVYFYRIKAVSTATGRSAQLVKKMVLLR